MRNIYKKINVKEVEETNISLTCISSISKRISLAWTILRCFNSRVSGSTTKSEIFVRQVEDKDLILILQKSATN